MSDRRSHWSDKLVDAVGAEIERYITVDTLNPQFAYAVIAAVEDWQDKQIIGCRYACIGGQGMELANRDLVIQRVKDYCERRREDRGGDLTALDVLRLLHGSPVVGDLSSQADDGQRLDVNALLSERMEQVERAKRAEAEVERLNRIISESKPWIAMTDELTDFIAAHPHCDVQIVGEYGDVYPLDSERIQAVQHLVDTGSIAAPVLTEHDKGYNLALQHVKEALGGESDD